MKCNRALWNAKTGKQIFSQRDIWRWTRALAFSVDGDQLFFGGQNGITEISSETGEYISETGVYAVDAILGNDGTNLFLTDDMGPNQIYDLSTGNGQEFPICEVYLAGADDAGACPMGIITIFDLATGEILNNLHTGVEGSELADLFGLSPDGNFLAYYGETDIQILDTQTAKIKTLDFADFQTAQVGLARIDGSEKYVAAVPSQSGQIGIYDLETGSIIRTLKLECCAISGFAFAPDQRTAATIADKKILNLWDLQSMAPIYEAKLGADFSGPIAFSPDGLSIFTTHIAEDYISEFNLQTRRALKHGKNSYAYDYADPFAVENYHFNSQGNLVVLGYDANRPMIKDIRTDEKIIIPFEAVADPDFVKSSLRSVLMTHTSQWEILMESLSGT